jgi:hypothetical protein
MYSARASWILIDSIQRTSVGQTWRFEQEVLDLLQLRQSQIPAEALAPVGACDLSST